MQKLTITDQTTREELVAGYEELATELSKTEFDFIAVSEELAEANKTVEDLKQKLAESGAKVSAKNPVITVDKVQYEVTIPQFNFNGKVYKAADLESDKELCKDLVAIEFGGLREIRDRKKS